MITSGRTKNGFLIPLILLFILFFSACGGEKTPDEGEQTTSPLLGEQDSADPQEDSSPVLSNSESGAAAGQNDVFPTEQLSVGETGSDGTMADDIRAADSERQAALHQAQSIEQKPITIVKGPSYSWDGTRYEIPEGELPVRAATSADFIFAEKPRPLVQAEKENIPVYDEFPVDIPPVETVTEAVEVAPVEAPPEETLVVEVAPLEALPEETPVVEVAPVEAPPEETLVVEVAPVAVPPEETLVVEVAPLEALPEETPVVEVAPVAVPPEETLVVEVAPVAVPPEETLVVEVAPLEAPPEEPLVVEVAPVESPPEETLVVEVAPVESPPEETL
ncbi:MAG: hypothetical protein JEY99_11410, partial [Spirochaetales bacterium]|nr:hypothetical protein [Spirochaetales bacterium]